MLIYFKDYNNWGYIKQAASVWSFLDIPGSLVPKIMEVNLHSKVVQAAGKFEKSKYFHLSIKLHLF